MRRFLGLVLAPLFAALLAAPSLAQNYSGSGAGTGLAGIFDEVRLGTVFSIEEADDDSGVIVSGQLYTRPFVRSFQNYFANTFLRPRLFIGGNLATGDDGVSQVYGGLNWVIPVYDPFFIEASFGGTWHDGPLETPGDGLDLGCHWLFHERLGVGVNLGQHWRVVAEADHSSHAHVCEGKNGIRAGNSGLTHAGIYAGYRF